MAAARVPPALNASAAATDAGPDSRWVDEPVVLGPLRGGGFGRRLQQHRLWALVLGALLGVAGLFSGMQWLASQPHLPGHWQASPEAGLHLLSAPEHAGMALLVGRDLVQLHPPQGPPLRADINWLRARPAWVADDAARAQWYAGQQGLTQALAWAGRPPPPTAQGLPLPQPAPAAVTPVAEPAPGGPTATASALAWTAQFADGSNARMPPVPRGLSGLGLLSWVLGLLAMALLLSAWLLAITHPGPAATLYALLAAAHASLLALAAAESLPGLGQAIASAPGSAGMRWTAEALAAAALLHLLWRLLRPQALARWMAPAIWLAACALALAASLGQVPQAALVLRTLTLAGLLATVLLLQAAVRLDGSAVAVRLRPLLGAGLLGLLAMGAAWPLFGDARAGQPSVLHALAPLWTGAMGAAVLAAPVLAWPQQPLREWSIIAFTAAVALAAALLQAVVLDVPPLAALLVALGLTVAGVAAARPWIDSHLATTGTLSAERLFDCLYRAARAVEQSPQRSSEHVAELLRELFDPLELLHKPRPLSGVRVTRDGSAMAVPVPDLEAGAAGRSHRTLLLRHARRGQRRFTEDDRQLAERLLEQLRRAVAYDRAVEHGRAEERSRIAQDLHDDIGARLLTLMYKAPDSEIEEYIRHTLQDLKTLTRGLAAANPRLSHAAAEWKADISQRLHPTGCDLRWSFTAERDFTLNVVQWSGLTRVLRELVNNILAHAQATQVEVALHFDGHWLALQVTDDGIGRAPAAWSHGLGLGGVRKRVKQLGGQVQWQEHVPRGIRCDIRVLLDPRTGGGSSRTGRAAAPARPRA